MSERAEGRMDWEFDAPVAIGAVPKLIADIRFAVVSVCVCSAETRASDEEMAAAFLRVRDALNAFDEAAKVETVNG